MKSPDPQFVEFRILGAFAGLIGGALLGPMVLLAVIIFTDRAFGLQNVLPAAFVGAPVGFVVGWIFPDATCRFVSWL
jgi:hypothetical protein